MSLEKAIEELKASIDELNNNIKAMANAAKAANKTVATAKPSAKEAEKDDEVDGEEEKPKTRRAAAKKDAPAKPARAKKVTVKEVLALAEKFLDVDDDDEYETRRETIKTVVTTLGVKKLSELEEQADIAKAHEVVTALIDGQDLAEIEGFGDEEDEEEDAKPARRKRDDL